MADLVRRRRRPDAAGDWKSALHVPLDVKVLEAWWELAGREGGVDALRPRGEPVHRRLGKP